MTNILLVEDELSILKLYEIVLSTNGFQVIAKAKNGEEAVNKYKKMHKKIDVIIMDHRMPLKNGLEATKEILEINHNAKIIFATADEEIEQKARKLGIASFKKKPFSNQRLVNNIYKAMKKNQNAPINLV